MIKNKQVINARLNEVGFYRMFLKGFHRGDLVYDIGANEGTKTDIFLRLGARVVAVEPDTINQEVLRQKFLTYRLAKKPVTIVGKAVSNIRSVETMWIDPLSPWMNTLNSKWVNSLASNPGRFENRVNFCQQKLVETITLSDLIAAHGVPFFIKIDVEGYEAKVLQGLQHRVPYVSFEVNLPEFKIEGIQCIEALGTLESGGQFNYSTDLGGGMALDRWLGPREFLTFFAQCSHKSIEIFWRAN
jgi:FkbM family methyltransferase